MAKKPVKQVTPPKAAINAADPLEFAGVTGLDETTGKVALAYAGSDAEPWHGLGFKIDPLASLDEWAEAASMTWSAVSGKMTFKDLDGKRHAVPGKKVLYRSDNNVVLGLVASGYHTVQPNDILGFFRDMVGAFGSFTMETLGAVRDGRKIWALARAKDEIRLGKEEVVNRYLLVATSFDKSLPTIVQQTSLAPVCMNTLRASLALGKSNAAAKVHATGRISVRHMTKFDATKVKQQIMVDEDWKGFAAAVNLLAGAKVKDKAARSFFLDVFYPPEFRATSKRYFEKGAERQVDKLMEVYATAPGQELEVRKGTAWGLLNAVTRYVDHELKSESRDYRLDKAWFGSGADMKDTAFKMALQLAGA